MNSSPRRTSWFLLVFASGCAKPYEPPADEGSTDCVPVAGEVCQEDDDEVGDEAGDSTTDGVELLEPGSCIINDTPGVLGYRHQCEGSVDYTVEFDITFLTGDTNCDEVQNLAGPPLCSESHTFGGEDYGEALVAACCGPYDDDPARDAVYLEYCELDLANQLCHTLVDRLTYHKNNNHFAGFETQAQSIINYVSSEIGACTLSFIENDVDDSPAHLDSHYTLPDNEAWPVFRNFTITVDIGDITGFHLPTDEADWLECQGMQGNDGYPFPMDQGMLGGIDAVLASPMKADLAGPHIFGSSVRGVASMGSRAHDCRAPWCSRAEFSLDDAGERLSLASLVLHADSDVTIANEIAAQTLVGVRIELAAAVATRRDLEHVSIYRVAPGEASFWAIGGPDDDPAGIERFLLTNSTEISITRVRADAWRLAGFALEYVDFEGRSWTIALPESTWE